MPYDPLDYTEDDPPIDTAYNSYQEDGGLVCYEVHDPALLHRDEETPYLIWHTSSLEAARNIRAQKAIQGDNLMVREAGTSDAFEEYNLTTDSLELTPAPFP